MIAVLVIFVFLRSWQATLITALAIPLSLLGTYIVMAIYGFNLETITLLGLALVIGIIVDDDAIVEVENIIRHLDLGTSPRQAGYNRDSGNWADGDRFNADNCRRVSTSCFYGWHCWAVL